MISKLAPSGTAGFVLANGSMSTSGKDELEIRKNLIEQDMVECIVTLPGQPILFNSNSSMFVVHDKK